MDNTRILSVVSKALKSFEETWEEQSSNEPLDKQDEYTGNEDMRGRSTAVEMLFNYVAERLSFLTGKSFTLLELEKPFAVPLDNSGHLFYIGRLDKVFKLDGRIYIGEHKTTTSYKKDGPFQSSFMESFSPNSQVDGYLYCGHIMFGDKLKAVWVDAALVHKTVRDGFRWIPIERQLSNLSAFVWDTHYYINQIRANDIALLEFRKGKNGSFEYMPAFPKNTSRCTDFGQCPFLNICKMWSNPEAHPEIPDGYIQKKWEPFDELGFAKAKDKILSQPNTKVTRTMELYDNTRIQDSRNCLRYFYFRHRRHLRSTGDKRALLFGSSWHSAMDTVWSILGRR